MIVTNLNRIWNRRGLWAGQSASARQTSSTRTAAWPVLAFSSSAFTQPCASPRSRRSFWPRPTGSPSRKRLWTTSSTVGATRITAISQSSNRRTCCSTLRSMPWLVKKEAMRRKHQWSALLIVHGTRTSLSDLRSLPMVSRPFAPIIQRCGCFRLLLWWMFLDLVEGKFRFARSV